MQGEAGDHDCEVETQEIEGVPQEEEHGDVGDGKDHQTKRLCVIPSA